MINDVHEPASCCSPCWNFRPTALLDDGSYRDATPSVLMDKYLRDGERAAAAAAAAAAIDATAATAATHATADDDAAASVLASVGPPTQPADSIRICQWNIHYLSAPWLTSRTTCSTGTNSTTATCTRTSPSDPLHYLHHADQVAQSILDTNSDVVVLNEFGTAGRNPKYGSDRLLEHLCRRLEGDGQYTIYDLAISSYPTAVAVRSHFTVVSSEGIRLDSHHRSAVRVSIDPRSLANIASRGGGGGDKTAATTATTSPPLLLHIYGTHLDHSCGQQRYQEAKNLIRKIKQFMTQERRSTDPVLIVGDFNQQRACDYTPDEWRIIGRNLERREAPRTDGVSDLLQSEGFRCCYDTERERGRRGNNAAVVRTNWREGDPPPSTHWSSTVIDYAYGRNIDVVGIYVLPRNLSDHRMVITDWRIPSSSTEARK
eukprot:CAMPEP_0178588424 /NCGR_PEP_ID=MMETSP0697-20121206/27025_1 /TAXON_ID=265572 /ORGANISM="Extubocellulus spinifer, Strain CCMP396" /LENGTH=429 /DNA_ID=CAMNT_0020224771 /DNA_START=98 /DNA_END=1387 /DNA_ORIENTATION=+